MSYEENVAAIVRGVRTRQDQVKLLMQLEDLSSAIYKTGDGNLENSLKSAVSSDVAEIISTLVKEGEDPKTLLRKLIDAVKNLQALKITVAVNPSKEMIEKIYHWIDQNVSAEIILEVVVDESLIGGVKISYLGKYADYSVLSRFEDYWKRRPAI